MCADKIVKLMMRRQRLGVLGRAMFGRAALCVAICIFTIPAIVLGGTYAWFFSSVAGNGGEFTFAKFGLESESGAYGSHTVGFDNTVEAEDAHGELRKMLSERDSRDEALAEWIMDGNLDLILLREDSEILRFSEQCGKGSFIIREVPIENISEISVYLRTSRPVLADSYIISEYNIEYDMCALWIISDNDGIETGRGIFIQNGEGGDLHYYCSQPLDPGYQITVVFAYYIADFDKTMSADFTPDLTAEIIQATNNAVCLHPEWEGMREVLIPTYDEQEQERG